MRGLNAPGPTTVSPEHVSKDDAAARSSGTALQQQIVVARNPHDYKPISQVAPEAIGNNVSQRKRPIIHCDRWDGCSLSLVPTVPGEQDVAIQPSIHPWASHVGSLPGRNPTSKAPSKLDGPWHRMGGVAMDHPLPPPLSAPSVLARLFVAGIVVIDMCRSRQSIV